MAWSSDVDSQSRFVFDEASGEEGGMKQQQLVGWSSGSRLCEQCGAHRLPCETCVSVRRARRAAVADQVIAAARELDELFGGTVRRWTLDGKVVSFDASVALLSLHGYLNDLRAAEDDAVYADVEFSAGWSV